MAIETRDSPPASTPGEAASEHAPSPSPDPELFSPTTQPSPSRWRQFLTETRGFFAETRLDPFPLRHWLRHYTRAQARDDAQAAINVALLDIPLAMAYALIAGLPMQFGLYCAITSTILGPFWASSRFIILGPSNATAVLLMSTLAALNLPHEQTLAAVPILVLLVGIFLLVGTLLRLNSLVQFISHSVVTGYITAAAFLIIANQIPSALGFHIEKQPGFLATVREIFRNFHFAHLASAEIAVGTLLICLGVRRWAPKKLPHVALSLVAATLLATAVAALSAHFGHPWEPEMFSAISAASWRPTWPAPDPTLAHQLANGALAISFLALLESSSIAKALAARAGERVDLNQQTFSLGLVNIANAFTGGMTASGSPTRSTFTAGTTAGTPMVSVFCGLFVLVFTILAGGLLAYVPRSALAALVILVGITLFHRDQIRLMLHTTKSDATVFLITFVCGLVFSLDAGIYLGAAASIVLFLRKVSSPQLMEIAFNAKGELTEKSAAHQSETPEISIVHVEGELFFGASDIFYEQARLLVEAHHTKIIILRLRNARHLDATCALALRDLINFSRQRGGDVVASGVPPDLERVFCNSGLLEVLGEKNFFRTVPYNPNISTRNALKRAIEILGSRQANITVFAKAKPAAEPSTVGDGADAPAKG